jgi:hypothetical protein
MQTFFTDAEFDVQMYMACWKEIHLGIVLGVGIEVVKTVSGFQIDNCLNWAGHIDKLIPNLSGACLCSCTCIYVCNAPANGSCLQEHLWLLLEPLHNCSLDAFVWSNSRALQHFLGSAEYMEVTWWQVWVVWGMVQHLPVYGVCSVSWTVQAMQRLIMYTMTLLMNMPRHFLLMAVLLLSLRHASIHSMRSAINFGWLTHHSI